MNNDREYYIEEFHKAAESHTYYLYHQKLEEMSLDIVNITLHILLEKIE